MIPAFLAPGDTIAVVSTAYQPNNAKLIAGISLLKQAGFKVINFQQDMEANGCLAGTDEARLQSISLALQHPEVKAIWFSRGGYGSSRLLNDLEKTGLAKKWIIGFSDITALHQLWLSHGIAAIHGPMVTHLEDDTEGFEATWQLLLGKRTELLWSTPFVGEFKAEGILFGGNLSLLAHMCGSRWNGLPRDMPKILFLEEVGEKCYHIDRMLVQFKYAGHFENVQAVILGDFSDLSNEANFPQTVVEMIQYHSQATVVDGLQSGHCKPNYPLLLGANHKLAVANHKASLTLTMHQDFLVSI